VRDPKAVIKQFFLFFFYLIIAFLQSTQDTELSTPKVFLEVV
jgi:hypothetical protein